MKKKSYITSAVMALGVFLVLPAAMASASDEQLARDLELLRNKVAAQQEHIDALEGKLEKKSGGSGANEGKQEKKSEGQVVLGNEFIDQLKLKGDLRVRYEARDIDYKDGKGSDYSRERWRTRFRVGGVWENKAENWQVGAGLATGSDDPTSTNATYSETKPFETGDIRLDYAYAKNKWNDFSLTIGQAENPYTSSWVFWDSDVRLSGLTAQYGQKDGVFAVLGEYAAKLVHDDNTATLTASQAGYRGEASGVKYTLAGGYHLYSKSLLNDASATFFLDKIDAEKYKLNIGDLYGDVSIPLGEVKVKLYGQLWKNFGADGLVGQSQAGSSFTKTPQDANLGYVFGADGKYGPFSLGLAYSLVEADSLFGYLSDSDFGDGLSKTNKKGYRVQLGYELSKNWNTSLSWLSYKRAEDFASAKEDHVNLAQLDVNYKF